MQTIIRSQKIILSSLIVAGLFLFGSTVIAEDFSGPLLQTTGQFFEKSGYQNADVSPYVAIGNIIGVVLSLLGIVFLVYAVYAGVKWMTAGGNSDQVDEAKAALRNATIGLAIVLLAYAIVLAIFTIAGFGFNTGLTNWSNVD